MKRVSLGLWIMTALAIAPAAMAQSMFPDNIHVPSSELSGETTPPPTGEDVPQTAPSDDWITAQGAGGWIFLAGPEHAKNTMVRLTNTSPSGQFGLYCSKQNLFDFVLFPRKGLVEQIKPGTIVNATIRIAGISKTLPLIYQNQPSEGFIASGRAIPAMLEAIARVPDGVTQDMSISFSDFLIRAPLPSPRSLSVVAADMCGQWYSDSLTKNSGASGASSDQ